ncbi:MAG: hypothetical protein PF448_04050 [Bacteroidales bacterium]|jgi:hypothetical protein|nr:hypothetical protein [Bacteroidales bacterium]
MELGDLFNLLLLVLFIVIGPIIRALSKNKKEKLRVQNVSQDSPQGFGSLLGTFSDEIEALRREKAEAFENERMNNTPNAIQNSAILTNENDDLNAANKNTPNDSPADDLRESFKQNVNKNQNASDIAKSFDIKKAVIFSEILNTKYF